MARRMVVCAAVLGACFGAGHAAAVQPASAGGGAKTPAALLTIAERTDFKATARHADVVALLDRLAASSPLARRVEMGVTGEARSIPVLVLADPPVSSPAEAHAASGRSGAGDGGEGEGRMVVLAFANIHAGEVDGKEALPMLAREVLLDADGAAVAHPGLLKNLIICIAPIYNADGNERFDKANRPGQVGPDEGMGIRENAKGFDLNRDFVKLECAETRALVGFINAWDPTIVIDCHTTNGSNHRYLLTYAGPKAPAGDDGLIRYVRDEMFPAIGGEMKARAGIDAFPYGDLTPDHTKWETFGATARYGTTCIGLRNRIGILSEAYAYATYKERVLGTREFVRSILLYAAGNTARVQREVGEAERRTVEAGERAGGKGVGGAKGGNEMAGTGEVAVRAKAAAAPERLEVLGYVEEEKEGHQVSTGVHAEYRVELWDRFEPTLSVTRPWAYVVPAERRAVVENLRRHGVALEKVLDPAEVDAEVYRVDAVTRALRPFQGHSLVTVDATARAERRTLAAGSILVRTAQPLGNLIVYLFEPACEDGLTTWNFFDDDLTVGGDFPVVRLPSRSEVKTGPLPAGDTPGPRHDAEPGHAE